MWGVLGPPVGLSGGVGLPWAERGSEVVQVCACLSTEVSLVCNAFLPSLYPVFSSQRDS